jgi:hypothetical protein
VAASLSSPPPGEATAAEFGLTSVAGTNLHIHRDVIVYSIGDSELTPTLGFATTTST